MKIILDIDPGQIDWSDKAYAKLHTQIEEVWGAPEMWENVDFHLEGKFYGEPIEVYDDPDGASEWEAVQYLLGK
jgi:hypothetical protein